jgi:hypothetical protein
MNRQKGVAAVELALVLPLLLIITFITTEFGRALYQYNIISKSVRNAVRYLSMQDPSIATTDPEKKVDIAKNLVVYGIPAVEVPAGAASPLANGLELSQVSNPTWAPFGSNPTINTVTIKVTGYKFRLLIPSAFGLQFGDANGEITFGDISATMRAQS